MGGIAGALHVGAARLAALGRDRRTASLGAVGYAVMDLMPWSMLGEVVDEDDLVTGERREGIYYGLFMFVRKLGGTIAVALALGCWARSASSPKARSPSATLTAIRGSASIVPAGFLLVSARFARGYPLTRARARARSSTRCPARLIRLVAARRAGSIREPGAA